MNTLIEIENVDTIENIEDMIYEVRGKQVMLDSDLAILYNTETKRINEAVVRNIKKFPERYCFRITEDEVQERDILFLQNKVLQCYLVFFILIQLLI